MLIDRSLPCWTGEGIKVDNIDIVSKSEYAKIWNLFWERIPRLEHIAITVVYASEYFRRRSP